MNDLKKEKEMNEDEFLKLPKVLDIVEEHYGDKEELIKEVLKYDDCVQSLWNKFISIQALEKKVSELECSVKALEDDTKYLGEVVNSPETEDHFSYFKVQ